MAGAWFVPVASAQSLVLQESVLGSAGGVNTVGTQTIASAVGQTLAGRSTVGTTELFSGFPSPVAGIAVLTVRHVLPEPDDPRPGGSDVPVTLRVTPAPGVDVTSVRLLYRAGRDAPEQVPMSAVDDGFEATIPGAVVGASGVAYAFEVEDASGRVVRAPSRGVFSFAVGLDAPGIARGANQPTGTTQNAYRLVALPLAADDPSPTSVLGDDLPTLLNASAYDRSRVRLFESGTRAEFPQTRSMTVGRAFWLIVAEGAQTSPIDTGPGAVQSLAETVSLPLSQGWNYVGTPVPVSVPVAQLRLTNGDPVVLRRFDADGYNGPDAPVQSMEPFEGYALFSEDPTTLRVDPAPPLDGATLASGRPADAKRDDAPDGLTWRPVWSLRLTAASAGGRSTALAAVVPGASDGRDALDWPVPPSLSTVTVAFDRPEWGASDVVYASDVRPDASRGATWTVDVTTPPKADATVSVDGVDAVPADLDAWLVDTQTLASVDLRVASTLRVPATDDGTARLTLLVGPPRFVQKRLRDAGALPAETVIGDPYPNPAVQGASIRIGLPASVPVRMEVYNLLGQRVATAYDRTMPTGYHVLRWDVRSGGRPLASGVYFLRIYAGDERATRKVVVVR